MLRQVVRMKKYALSILRFFAIMGTVTMLCLLLNDSLSNRIENGGRLPADIVARHYVVSGLDYDHAAGGYHISFTGAPEGTTLAFTFYFRLAQVWQNGELLADLSSRTAYQRTYSVPVTADENGRLDLFFKTTPSTVAGYSFRTLFTRYAAQSPKLILGSQERTLLLNTASNNFYRILIGLYLMLMAACLILYRRKRTEGYLLTVCAAVAFVLLYLLTALERSMVLFPYGLTDKLSTLTNLFPVSCLAYTCIGLFPKAVPQRFKRLFSLPSFLAVTIVCVIADLVFGIYMYQFLRRLMLFPVLVTMACALQMRLQGSRMIFASYAMMEGIALFLYINNCILDQEYSPLLMFLRVKEISNLIFVAACAFQIFDRFSAKFVEADRLAEEVSALNVDLEQKVTQRTAELREEQEHKHSMMLNVFHDLRSPIFVLRGRLAAMKDGSAKDEESLAVMDTRLKYLEKLIEELFLTAKLESGDVEYDQDLVDLSQLYTTVLRDMASAALTKNVTLTGEAVFEPLTVWGDAFRLQQVVVNLVENALLYTPEGSRVTLTLYREKDRCLLEVADQGPGIRPEDLPRVFERYYRVPHGNKRSSGLGLSIAKEIVTAHQGEIRVTSQVGEGSVFTIDLPYCPPSGEDA